jgi:ribosome biogenesis GTPase
VFVQPVCAHTGQGMDRLQAYLGSGESVGFIGPSGVGKSSLINCILGEQRQATGEARSLDSKGRHTTTRRQLVQTPEGALLIDTPGMREVALFSPDGRAVGFEDVQALAQECRFSDCEHDREPGCAVIGAIERGTLPAVRLQTYRSMARDAQRQAVRHDAYARHVVHQQTRQFGKRVRETTSAKRKG